MKRLIFILTLLASTWVFAKEATKKEDDESAVAQKSAQSSSANSSAKSLCEGVNREPDSAGNQPCLGDERIHNAHETAAYVQYTTSSEQTTDASPTSRYSGPFTGQTAATVDLKASTPSNRSDKQEHQQ